MTKEMKVLLNKEEISRMVLNGVNGIVSSYE